jgi:uncharacterized protein YdeI (YjbR/CyaY-like superfamily)
MGTRDPRVDTYIETSAPFARPILTLIREVVHDACPEVEETIKWRFPNFMYRGMLCSMASFKKHCAFGFWKSTLVFGEHGNDSNNSMGQFGRIESIDDLPSKAILTGYIRKAMRLNEEGVSRTKPDPSETKAGKKTPPAIPNDLQSALRHNAAARTAFASFSPSQQRDYIEWLTEAKREETRKRRLETAIEWISEGKTRNWKYIKS